MEAGAARAHYLDATDAAIQSNQDFIALSLLPSRMARVIFQSLIEQSKMPHSLTDEFVGPQL